MAVQRAFATLAARSARGRPEEALSRSLTMPVYQSTVYAFEDLGRLEALNQGAPGSSYYRYGTPNGSALEEAMCALESADSAVCAAFGMAIIAAAVLAVAEHGDHVVPDRHTYRGTYTLLTRHLPRNGGHRGR